jgi:hypothetical protein
MLPAVTRPDPPITGDERTLLAVWLDSRRGTPLRKCALLEGADPARRDAAGYADCDVLQVSTALADVVLCMRHEPVSLWRTRIDGHVVPAHEHIDGSVGG